MEGVAKFDFRANQEDEISFRANEILKILQLDEDRNWYRAELNGQIGYVPKNRIDLRPSHWYKGRLTRRDAENILLHPSMGDGAFLVRDSESTPGDFSLSVRFDNSVEHYRVLRDSAGKYFLWVVKFNSLNELIEYHKTHSISRTLTILLREVNFPTSQRLSNPANANPHRNSNHNHAHGHNQDHNSRQQTFLAVAAYRFVGEENNELSFEPQEQITVDVYYEGNYNLNQQWWFGRIQRGFQTMEGLFPSNYVTITDSVRQQYNIQSPTA